MLDAEIQLVRVSDLSAMTPTTKQGFVMQLREFSLETFACDFLPTLASVETYDAGGNQVWRGEHATHGLIIAVGSPHGAVQVVFEH